MLDLKMSRIVGLMGVLNAGFLIFNFITLHSDLDTHLTYLLEKHKSNTSTLSLSNNY